MPPHNCNDSSGQRPDSEQPYKHARVIRDGDGMQWFAHEVREDALAAGEPCLLLVSIRQVRRISPVPPNWRALDAEALLALSYLRL